jgi:hypothetical protein
MAAKLTEMREKHNSLLKEKADMQSELIWSEEEKLEISKSYVELQIDNANLLEQLQNYKYGANTKQISSDQEILAL